MDTFIFNPTTGLLDTDIFPKTPASETAARQQFMVLFNQLKDCLNDSVKVDIDSIKTAPAWELPTLLNSWVNYGTPEATAGYLKDAMGFVHLKGTIKNGSQGSQIFVLPVGLRPNGNISFAVTTGGGVIGNVGVTSDGIVVANTSSSSNLSLNGIIFKAEQ